MNVKRCIRWVLTVSTFSRREAGAILLGLGLEDDSIMSTATLFENKKVYLDYLDTRI